MFLSLFYSALVDSGIQVRYRELPPLSSSSSSSTSPPLSCKQSKDKKKHAWRWNDLAHDAWCSLWTQFQTRDWEIPLHLHVHVNGNWWEQSYKLCNILRIDPTAICNECYPFYSYSLLKRSQRYSFQTMREHGWEKGRQTWHINMKQQCGRVIFHHGNIILFIECNK